MKHRQFGAAGAAVVAIVAGAALTAGVQAKGVDVRQIALTPMTCTTAGSGTLGFNKSGSRVTLNVAESGIVGGSAWTVTVTDSVAGLVGQTPVAATTATSWSAFVNYDSPKGNRTVTVIAAAAGGTNTCRGTLSYKV